MTPQPSFILCASDAEAEQIAARLELKGEWFWLDNPIRIAGLRKPVVWRTPCWFYGRPDLVQPMWTALKATKALMATVACTTHRPLAPSAEDPPKHPAM